MTTPDEKHSPAERAKRQALHATRITTRPLIDRLVLSGVAGVLGGAAVLIADVALSSVIDLQLSNVQSFRSLLTSLVGGLITVAVFSLWMRTVVVGLVSDQFSPRALASFLSDRFQHRLLAVMSGALVFEAVLLLGLSTQTDAAAPPIALVTSVAVAVAALGGVLLAVRHAVTSLSLPEVVSTLTDNIFEVLERQPAEGDPVDPAEPGPHASTLSPSGIGWVGRIDSDQMMDAIPPGAVVHLRTKTGDFVSPSRVLAMITPPPDGSEVDLDEVCAAIQIDRVRSHEFDLALAMGQLVDVAVHALAGGGKDTATAHEAVVHLGAALEEIVQRGLPVGTRRDDYGRVVIDEASRTAADHVKLVCERLRDTASAEPVTSRDVVSMLGYVRVTAERVGDERTVEEVDHEISMIVDLAAEHGMVGADAERLRDLAARTTPGRRI